MSRITTGADVIPVQSGNNVYTVLVAVATVVQALALMVLFVKYSTAFEGFPFTMSK